MGKPLISVIVPVYNAENYIYSCIESILSQTFTDFELILVDDGSQDGSGKISDNYQLKDTRIRVIHQNNSGPSFARKTGFQNANGGYLCFIDSDDYIEKDYLKILYSKTTDNCDLVCSNCKDGHISADEYIRGLLLGKHGWEMWNKLFSKNAINDSVFNLPPKLKIGEDFIANILIAKNIKSVSLVTEPGNFCIMRIH